jgi:hypothetical protein
MAASAGLSLCSPFLQPRDGAGLEDLDGEVEQLIGGLYDSMTECLYQQSISSFSVDAKPQAVFEVDILGLGRAALQEANDDLGRCVWCVCVMFFFESLSLFLFLCLFPFHNKPSLN